MAIEEILDLEKLEVNIYRGRVFSPESGFFQRTFGGHVAGQSLVSAVRTVGAGRSLLDTRAAAALLARIRSDAQDPGPVAGLTDQERTVLGLIGEGLTNRQIGERMFLAEKTVKNYVSSVLAKLGMQRRTQVAVLATEIRDKNCLLYTSPSPRD